MDRCSAGVPPSAHGATAILKYCKKWNCICAPSGRPVGSVPLAFCQLFLSVSEFQGQSSLPQSIFWLFWWLSSGRSIMSPPEIWQSGGPAESCFAGLPVFQDGCGKERKGCLGKPTHCYPRQGCDSGRTSNMTLALLWRYWGIWLTPHACMGVGVWNGRNLMTKSSQSVSSFVFECFFFLSKRQINEQQNKTKTNTINKNLLNQCLSNSNQQLNAGDLVKI